MLKLALPVLVLAAVVGLVVATDGPRPRADLTIINKGEPSTIDPHTATWLNDLRVVRCLFEGLVRTDTRGPEGAFAPGVAERWELSGDRRTYTFHLRDTARWSDGTPVRAGDFVYAWRRALLPETGCDYITFFQRLQGAKAFTDWRTAALASFKPGDDARALWDETLRRFDESVGVKAVDDRTLRVTLARPAPYFLSILTLPATYPLNPRAMARFENVDPRSGRLETASGWMKPGALVGNGPFTIASWRFKRDMLLERSPHYWDPARIPSRRILVLAVDDAGAQILAFRSGAADWVSDVAAPYRSDMLADKLRFYDEHKAEVESLRAQGLNPIEVDRRLPPDPRKRVQVYPSMGTYFYDFNCSPKLPDGRDNPFADARVRRAFSMAVDRERIASQVRRLGERPAATLIPPGSLSGYEPPAGLRYDPAAARTLLAEAGHPGGAGLPTVEILYNTEGGHEFIAQAVKKDWEGNLGVSVSLAQRETKVFRADLKSGNYMVARAGWFGDYDDPTTFLDIHRTGDGNNDRKYASPEFDALMDRAEDEPDPAARLALLQDAERLLVERDLPVLPMFHYVQMYLFDPDRLEGPSTQPKGEQAVHEFEVRPRIGEPGRGAGGQGGRGEENTMRPAAEGLEPAPLRGRVDHADQHLEDRLVLPVQSAGLVAPQIAALDGVLDPALRLGGLGLRVAQLADERSLVAALAPRLADGGGDGPGRPSDLIGERVPLLDREPAAEIEQRGRGVEGDLVHLKLAVRADGAEYEGPPAPSLPQAPSRPPAPPPPCPPAGVPCSR